MIRQATAAALALSVLGATLAPANAESLPAQKPDLTRAYPGEAYAQYYYGRPYYARPYYGPRYYRHDRGSAVAAGVAGLAAGALIGGALATQARPAPPPPATVDPQLAAYCAQRFRSYDPVTGTYVSLSGERIVCTY